MACQFEPETSKDIDEANWPRTTMLKAQMNADLLTDDLKKKRASNESFWLIGHPNMAVKGNYTGCYTNGYSRNKTAVDRHIVPVRSLIWTWRGWRPGLLKTIAARRDGEIRSLERSVNHQLASCCVSTIRCINPQSNRLQVERAKADSATQPEASTTTTRRPATLSPACVDWIAFQMLDLNYDGRSLKAELDSTRMAACRGTASLPFEPGEHGRAAVKYMDNRGAKNLKSVELE